MTLDNSGYVSLFRWILVNCWIFAMMIQWCFLNLRVFGRNISMLQFICVHNSQCFTICFRYLFQICFKYIALFGNDSPPDFAHRLPAEEAAEPRRCSPTQPRREDTTNWNDNDNNDERQRRSIVPSSILSPDTQNAQDAGWQKVKFWAVKKVFFFCFFCYFVWLICVKCATSFVIGYVVSRPQRRFQILLGSGLTGTFSRLSQLISVTLFILFPTFRISGKFDALVGSALDLERFETKPNNQLQLKEGALRTSPKHWLKTQLVLNHLGDLRWGRPFFL